MSRLPRSLPRLPLWAPSVVFLSLVLMSSVGRAQDAAPFPESLLEVFSRDALERIGADAIERLDDDEIDSLLERCTDVADPDRCLQSNFPGAEDVTGDGEPDDRPGEPEEPDQGKRPGEVSEASAAEAPAYPPEALALLPAEKLDRLPRLVTAFLRPKDYVALKQACPQERVDEAMTCIYSEDTAALLDKLHEHAVVATMLSYMDAELPNRIPDQVAETLARGCDEPGGAWANCAFTNGLESLECLDREDELAECLVDNDVVGQYYLDIARDKKDVFGRDLYVEFAGLMSMLTVDEIRQLRTACPQNEMNAAGACFLQFALIAERVDDFHEEAKELALEAERELAEHGQHIDVPAETEKILMLFLRLPERTIDSMSGECLQRHPELEIFDQAHELDQLLSCVGGLAKTDAVSNPAYISPDKLRKWLAIARTKVVKLLKAKEHSKQDQSFRRIALILGILAAVGFICILCLPLYLGRKYPGQGPRLWRASVIAAGTFATTVVLLGVTLLVMRAVQVRVAADSTSPKMKIAQGVFEVLQEEESIQGFSQLSRERLDFIKGPLRTIVEDTTGESQEKYAVFVAYVATHWAQLLQEPELKHLARNKKLLAEHVAAFKGAVGFYKKVDWIMGWVPILLSLLAVVLYLIPLREVLVGIATAPLRTAATGSREDLVAQARQTVWGEMKSVLPFLAIILLLLPLVGIFLSLGVKPLVEMLLGYSFQTMSYILLAEASPMVLYSSIAGVSLLLIACMAVYILGMAFFLGTTRKILRAKFHHGHTFASYKRFWLLGTVILLAVMAFPVGYAHLADYLAMDVWRPNEVPSTADMVLIPLVSLLAFPLLFWLVRGFRGLAFIKKYPVNTQPMLDDIHGSGRA